MMTIQIPDFIDSTPVYGLIPNKIAVAFVVLVFLQADIHGKRAVLFISGIEENYPDCFSHSVTVCQQL